MKKNKIFKSTLLNIDSAYRNLYPKNICKSDSRILPLDPLTFTKDSNIISIYHPNHRLQTGDSIIIQNVEGITKTLINSFYLINNFRYLIIDFGINYLKPGNDVYAYIDIFNEQTENNNIDNIPLNSLIGTKKILTSSDIPETYFNLAYSTIISIFGSMTLEELNQKYIFIELLTEYINPNKNFYNINQAFKISYLHIGGIKLGYLNANYPIGNYNYQSNYIIYNVVDDNNYQILLNFYSYLDINGGGKNIQIMKILNSITGYPDADEYTINLKKSFNNVINIELVSTEFPYVDVVIKKDVNDKLYWKNIEDGQTIYKVQIAEGFYTGTTLLDKIKSTINLVPRISSTKTVPLYNYFDIELETNIQKISFKPYNLIKLPNCLAITLVTIDSKLYYCR